MEEVLEEILQLSRKKMREQGAYSREAYKHYVDETIGYFIEKGKLSEEENTKFMQDRLMEMWERVEKKLTQ
jgi:polyhydroxyalkanoate synthesis regulator phasin